jgi:hypothetical protein
LTKKIVAWHWGALRKVSFQELKDSLTTEEVLTYALDSGQFILDTDASLYGMGAVLSQIQNGEEKVVCYASKTFSESQRKYCTTKRELLAVRTFVSAFRTYLVGQHFKIRTDHASLLWLLSFKQSDNMYCNWIMTLEQYDFEIEHRKGSLHGNADALSRIHVTRHCGRVGCKHCTDLGKNMTTVQVANADQLHNVQILETEAGNSIAGVTEPKVMWVSCNPESKQEQYL